MKNLIVSGFNIIRRARWVHGPSSSHQLELEGKTYTINFTFPLEKLANTPHLQIPTSHLISNSSRFSRSTTGLPPIVAKEEEEKVICWNCRL